MKTVADRLFGDEYYLSVVGAGRHQTNLVTMGGSSEPTFASGWRTVSTSDAAYWLRATRPKSKRSSASSESFRLSPPPRMRRAACLTSKEQLKPPSRIASPADESSVASASDDDRTGGRHHGSVEQPFADQPGLSFE